MRELLEGVEYYPVSALHLAIIMRLSDRDIPNVDPTILTVLPKLVIVEVMTQVCDDAIR
jgi:hypothetical protein